MSALRKSDQWYKIGKFGTALEVRTPRNLLHKHPTIEESAIVLGMLRNVECRGNCQN